MSQQKPPFWYRFLRPLRDTPTPISSLLDSSTIPEIKIITENDLKIEQILMEEFRFRGECLKQVASDITSTFNLFFLFIGISISGIGVIYQLAGGIRNNLQTIEALIFLILGVTSTRRLKSACGKIGRRQGKEKRRWVVLNQPCWN